MFFSEMVNNLYDVALKELESIDGVEIVRKFNPNVRASVEDTDYERLSELVVEFNTARKKGLAGLFRRREPVVGLEDIRERLDELLLSKAELFIHSGVMLQYNSLGRDWRKREYPVAVNITTRPYYSQVPSDLRPIQF